MGVRVKGNFESDEKKSSMVHGTLWGWVGINEEENTLLGDWAMSEGDQRPTRNLEGTKRARAPLLSCSFPDGTGRVRNTEVLGGTGKKMETFRPCRAQWKVLSFAINYEKKDWMATIGCRSGNRKTLRFKNLRDWFGVNFTTLFQAAISEVRMPLTIDNLRRGDCT